MPGFLSAIFAPADNADGTTSSSDQQSVGSHLDLDPSLHIHIGASGSVEHADGSVTNWSDAQDINAHLDIHAVTQFVLDEGHDSSSAA